jgi:hypothetical protein
MNDVSAREKRSSWQLELCVMSHNLAPTNPTIQTSQVSFTLIQSSWRVHPRRESESPAMLKLVKHLLTYLSQA